MVFLDDESIKERRIDWHKTIMVIEHAVNCIAENDYVQPVKPYLRFRDMKNRIIAMPAFVGGDVDMAGIKWISSFPQNISKGIPRAHSVVILNDSATGEPLAIIVAAILSVIRTASVSGLMLKRFIMARQPTGINIGIIGFGPIGQYHLKMCLAVLGAAVDNVFVYDIRQVAKPEVSEYGKSIHFVDNWQAAYRNADVLITCTVSDSPYINEIPKAGSLHLNVSLRDYRTNVYDWFKDSIIVDSWEEVCRERTDIEMMHQECGLQKEDTKSIVDVVKHDCLKEYKGDVPIMFNPMGMAVFDIALASYYLRQVGIQRR